MRGLAKAQALGGVGLRGLNGVDFCDPGWSAFGRILGSAGSVVTSINQASAASGPEGSQPDVGWGAVGAGTSALSTAWGTSCTNRAQQDAAQAQRDLNASLAQQRLANEQAIAQQRMQGELQIASLTAQRNQQGGGGGDTASSNQTLMIGAGVVGVVILGALLLRK